MENTFITVGEKRDEIILVAEALIDLCDETTEATTITDVTTKLNKVKH